MSPFLFQQTYIRRAVVVVLVRRRVVLVAAAAVAMQRIRRVDALRRTRTRNALSIQEINYTFVYILYKNN